MYRHVVVGQSFSTWRRPNNFSRVFTLSKQYQQHYLLQTSRYMQHLSSPELRQRFLAYFEKNGHTPVRSSSLIPNQQDKSLLFTNAGMVPFKEYFMNPSTAPYRCATSVQKCMRAGGKHNDLDNVGYTPRHHTFFEMLGNFSFGLYSKEKAIQYAWQFLLKELELPLSRLRVTVLEGDQEGYDLWKKQGLTDDMIVTCGPEDNFWSMGDGEGPCGPCTEIFWDTQDDSLGNDRWVEIWNLVFMENYRSADGLLSKLPIPCIDTGMGLERMACVLQEQQNNFQIDQFRDLISGLRLWMNQHGIKASTLNDPDPHEKIIADHFRSMCFLIGDGVVPSNVGRGYVLRRIIRRALRSARQLGIHHPFLTELYPYLLQGFSNDIYPELEERASSIQSIIENEEKTFLTTLDRGMILLDNVFNRSDLQHSKTIPPSIAFQLYDTFGFPFDLTLIIAQERGWTVDIQAVEKLQEDQKLMARGSWKSNDLANKTSFTEWKNRNILPTFTGYDHALFHQESAIVATETIQKGDKVQVYVAIDPCPFYGLGGGQVADTGKVTLANGNEWKVMDVQQPYEGCLALQLAPLPTIQDGILLSQHRQYEIDQQYLQVGQLVNTHVDVDRRTGAEIHHTATHLLNAGLRQVLQSDIVQAGSLVDPNKLRFDFTYGKPLSQDQLDNIENWVNEMILLGTQTEVKHMALTEAISSGAVATFSEKYSDHVRVIDVPGISKELCGGTHVDNIRKLYPFKILNETSVAAGTRRIEAIAGSSCIDWYRQTYTPIPQAMKLLRANSTREMLDKLGKTIQQSKDLEKRLDSIMEKMAQLSPKTLPIETKYKGIPLKIHLVDADLDSSFLQKRANVLKEIEQDTIHILVKENLVTVALNGKKISSETANSVLKHMLKTVKGGGGGQKELAQGRLAKQLNNDQDILTTLVPAFHS
ncbi:alanyl-tRNA synthetase [Halteromyces radiatus]|uniref:alanyl-tRNA synthetase n=1 Tax=Halteromyces radiatus TaxID=101107 RepID=UPI00221E7E31|nr:alanyl-tRNA synthetase [Halteromyces radiatus]KAI8097343.1 alanyl-tRNA synthetase [Halteromyces radiatus]